MIVVADDTDILVLLLYFWNSEMHDIVLQSMKNKGNMVNIRNVVSYLNKIVVKNLLLIHAWGGCDTVFNQGKTAILEKENPEVV